MNNIKPGGVIRYARAELGMSQAEFGRWIGERMGRDRPVDYQLVSKWERGERTPRMSAREACRDVAAQRALRAIAEIVYEGKAGDAVDIIVESQS